MRLFWNTDDAGGGSSGDSDTSPPAGDSASAPESTTSESPSFGFDSHDAFTATPWLSELDQERRDYLVNGVKSLYDRHSTAESERARIEAERAELALAVEAAKRDADQFRGFLEAANPDFADLRAQLTSLEARAKQADEATTELARVKAEYAAGEASRAELLKAQKEHSEAADRFKSERANLEIARDEAIRERDQFKTLNEEHAGVFSDALAEMVETTIRFAHPNASDADVDKATEAFLAEILKVGAVTRESATAAYKAATVALPKPDFVPNSVRAMNHSNATQSDQGDAAIKAAVDEQIAKGKASTDAVQAVAQERGLPVLSVMTAYSRRGR